MNLYPFILFFHIVGALGLFVTLGLEWASMLKLRHLANAEEARGWVNLIASLPRLYGPIWMVILFPGIYLTLTVWGWGTGWIIVSLTTILLFPILGGAMSGPRLQVIGRVVTTESGQLSSTFHNLLGAPLLWVSIHVRMTVALGIIFIMTTKPSWGGAVITISMAVLLGLASVLPMLRRRNK